MDAGQKVGAVQLSTRLRGVSPPVTRRLRVAVPDLVWRLLAKMPHIWYRIDVHTIARVLNDIGRTPQRARID
jgi:hypothetical protein